MSQRRIDRRKFVREGSAMVAGAAAAGALGVDKAAEAADPKKIINYNPKMHYRRLGKSNLMLSEISLGGHWKNRGGGRYWDTFTADEVPEDVGKNRTDVISACIDCGINYLDITTAAECLSYGVALKGRRESFHVGADDHRLGPRNGANRNVKALTHNIDECLRRLKTDYLDIWRVQADMGGRHTDAEVEVMIETFQLAHKAGKARHFGISTHHRPWAQHVIETFPEVEMFIFPCTAKTKEKGQVPSKETVVEGNVGHGADQSKSIFQSLREQNVGLVTIKPFAGGSLFKNGGKFPVMGVGSKEENDLARLTLQCIITNEDITATVPGLTTVYEVENAARVSYERQVAMTPRQERWLAKQTDQRWECLPEEYTWLRDWEMI
ncbi:MAG: aldo/keto reductase [Planctomycetes bacterium]|nr:aldo/keto reductase [Planctomycetota bacterium]